MPRSLLPAMILLVVAGTGAAAQTDYRNLDAGRPLLTEDAYPTARYAFEFTAAGGLERGLRDHRFELAPQLSWGVLPNTMVGVELPWVARTDRSDRFRLAGPRVALLHNFNSETPSLPALAFRMEAALPGGQWGGTGVFESLTGIATRSWGRWRTHLNLNLALGLLADAPLEAPMDQRSASLATDVTLWRQSLLLAGEVRVAKPIRGERTWRFGAGARWQFTPTLVLDAGVSRSSSSEAGRTLGFTLGVTHVFGIAALMPRGGK